MALHEWGQWDASLGKPSELADLLTVAWLRRKRVEARFTAIEVVTLLGQAMGGAKSGDVSTPENTRNNPATDAWLRGLGVDV